MSFRSNQIDRLFAFGRIHSIDSADGAAGWGGGDVGGYGGGGSNAGSGRGDYGYDTYSADRAEFESSADADGKYDANSAAGSFGSSRSAFEDTNSRRSAINNNSIAGLSAIDSAINKESNLAEPGIGISIESVDPNTGAISYGVPSTKTSRSSDGTVSISTDLSQLDKDGLSQWGARPSMARNYGPEARANPEMSAKLGQMVSIAQPNGVPGLLSSGIGMVTNPAVAMGLNGLIDANQAKGFRSDAFGIDTSLSQSIEDAGMSLARTTTGLLGSNMGGVIAGAVTGSPYGSVAGSYLGGKVGEVAFDNAIQSGNKSSTSAPSSGSGAGFEGFASTPATSKSAVSSINAGWNSNFGSYNSHVSGFKSYGSDSALDAFS